MSWQVVVLVGEVLGFLFGVSWIGGRKRWTPGTESLFDCQCDPPRPQGRPWFAHQPGCPERRKPAWEVTLLTRGVELTVEVYEETKEGARREARKLHPNCHIIHVEAQS